MYIHMTDGAEERDDRARHPRWFQPGILHAGPSCQPPRHPPPSNQGPPLILPHHYLHVDKYRDRQEHIRGSKF